MENYLFNWKQYVEINESNSEILSLTTGVPQGSIVVLYYSLYTLMTLHMHQHKLISSFMQMTLPCLLLLKLSSEILRT